MSDIMITPGTFFDGYVAVEYGDPITVTKIVKLSNPEVLNRADVAKVKNSVEEKITEACEEALVAIKGKVVAQKYNGIIGFKYDYQSLVPSDIVKTPALIIGCYVLFVTAQGTPVRIEKEKE